jgi:hypothetical protein
MRSFDFYFDIMQIKYTSFLAFANDVYLILSKIPFIPVIYESLQSCRFLANDVYYFREFLKSMLILKNA